MKKKNVLVTGITGQDGSYMAELALKENCNVFGLVRRASTPNVSRIQDLLPKITLLQGDLLDETSLMSAMKTAKPDYIFNFAAQSFVPVSWSEPVLTTEYTAVGVLRMLAAMKKICPDARFYQASSSEMFGKVQAIPQNEQTPFYPRSPYGVSKLYGHWITVNYRESYNMFACSGILFNHESERRGLEFVTRKVSNTVAKIHNGKATHIELGNLNSQRDWGHALDYVRAAWYMLKADKPDDYVISSESTHTIRELCEIAFKAIHIRLDWEGEGKEEIGIDHKTGRVLVKVNPEFFRPAEVDVLIGSSTKAHSELQWYPTINFQELVQRMVKHDLMLTGKLF